MECDSGGREGERPEASASPASASPASASWPSSLPSSEPLSSSLSEEDEDSVEDWVSAGKESSSSEDSELPPGDQRGDSATGTNGGGEK